MARLEIKTKSKTQDPEMPVQEGFGQGRRPEKGPFRLQVDRQTKKSFATLEEAEAAGLVIKTAYPVVQVAVYDSVNWVNKMIELPE